LGFDLIPKVAQQVSNIGQLVGHQNWQESLMMMFTSLPSSTTLSMVQTSGETSLAALILIAAAQGTLIMHQYATDPAGELVVPPGLTFGKEDAISESLYLGDQVENEATPVVADETTKPYESTQTFRRKNDDFLKSLFEQSQVKCTRKEGWYHVNRLLPLLAPFLAGQAAGTLALMEYSFLMHTGVIVGCAKIYDFFQQLPDTLLPAEDPRIELSDKPKILVLGDSMAVGVGSVNKFDPIKNSGIIRRIECLELDDNEEPSPGPIFPRAFARSLSRRIGKPVSWRSAGVDGGDTTDIREHLLGVVQEEVNKGEPPDIVVVLTGCNDLKHILHFDPEHAASVRGFQKNLLTLAQEIREISPKTKVVYPALPTYRLDRNSVLNVFPLSFFLDLLIGFWDSQKIRAAEKAPSSVFYYGLTAKDVNEWYSKPGSPDSTTSLLSADGIHPNAVCYQKWGTFLGDKVADTILKPQNEICREIPAVSSAYKHKRHNKWGLP
jgi:lysophospholipase L1-like esterase